MKDTYCPKCRTHLVLQPELEHSKSLKCPTCKVSFDNPHYQKPNGLLGTFSDLTKSQRNWLLGIGTIIVIFIIGSLSDDIAFQNNSPAVEILQHSYQYEPSLNYYTIHCRVKNNTSRLVSYLDIKATFYDKGKKIVGTGLGNAANLAAGAEKTVDVMALDVDNADDYEVQIDNIIYH